MTVSVKVNPPLLHIQIHTSTVDGLKNITALKVSTTGFNSRYTQESEMSYTQQSTSHRLLSCEVYVILNNVEKEEANRV